MKTIDELKVTGPEAACAVDRSCGPENGCGCSPSMATTTTTTTRSRRGFKAMVVGLLCVLGCLAVPIAIGGFAAVGSEIAGEAWILVAGLVAGVAIAVVLKRRDRGSIC